MLLQPASRQFEGRRAHACHRVLRRKLPWTTRTMRFPKHVRQCHENNGIPQAQQYGRQRYREWHHLQTIAAMQAALNWSLSCPASPYILSGIHCAKSDSN